MQREGGQGRGKAIVVVRSDVRPDMEDEYHRWYEDIHIPELVALPGYLFARRFRVQEADQDSVPRFMILYELEDETALESEGYKQIPRPSKMRPHYTAHTRQVYSEISCHSRHASEGQRTGKVIVVVQHDIAPEVEAAWNTWYNETHILELVALPGYLQGRRFRLQKTSVEPWEQYLAIYELEDDAILHSEAFKRISSAPETAKWRPNYTRRSRQVYRETFYYDGHQDRR